MSRQYLECVVNDRGFINKPAQVSEIAPTLRAQDHGNQPKVIEIRAGGVTLIVDNTYGFDDTARVYEDISPTLRASRQGLMVVEGETKTGGNAMNAEQPTIQVVGILDNGGTTQEHNNRVHDPEGIAPTLTAVSGGTHHIKIFDISRFRVRKLTPTEYGRLQAFPVDDGWEQVVSDSQAYHQFGNAVTTNVVEAIAINIRAFLDRRATATAPAEACDDVTDLSDAPQEIKDEIIRNDAILKAREDESPAPKTSGLEFFSNEELLAELNRRMTANV